MRPEVEAEIRAAWQQERRRSSFPDEGGGSVSLSLDRDPARHEAEVQQVFGRSWLPLAREDELGRPGSFVTRTIGRQPVALVRGSDGEVRVFTNVCPHRGAQLLRTPSGTIDSLRCDNWRVHELN